MDRRLRRVVARAALLALVALGSLLPKLVAQDVQRQSDWRPIDSVLLGVSTTALVLDGLQTLETATHPDRWVERNPILGSHPRASVVAGYFAVAVAAHAGLIGRLPPTWRRLWYAAVIVGEAAAVAHNHHVGVRISF